MATQNNTLTIRIDESIKKKAKILSVITGVTITELISDFLDGLTEELILEKYSKKK